MIQLQQSSYQKDQKRRQVQGTCPLTPTLGTNRQGTRSANHTLHASTMRFYKLVSHHHVSEWTQGVRFKEEAVLAHVVRSPPTNTTIN
jgi:N-acetyl-gamma-glutamylphosphate reductase